MKKIFFIAVIVLLIGLDITACSGTDNKSKTKQLAKNEMYTCTMHNELMSDHYGKCAKCGMKLVKQKMTQEQQKMMNEDTYTKPEN